MFSIFFFSLSFEVRFKVKNRQNIKKMAMFFCIKKELLFFFYFFFFLHFLKSHLAKKKQMLSCKHANRVKNKSPETHTSGNVFPFLLPLLRLCQKEADGASH